MFVPLQHRRMRSNSESANSAENDRCASCFGCVLCVVGGKNKNIETHHVCIWVAFRRCSICFLLGTKCWTDGSTKEGIKRSNISLSTVMSRHREDSISKLFSVSLGLFTVLQAVLCGSGCPCLAGWLSTLWIFSLFNSTPLLSVEGRPRGAGSFVVHKKQLLLMNMNTIW